MNESVKLRVTCAVALASLLLLSCSDASSDGARSSPEPARWTVEPTPVVTIGQVEGDAPYLFSRITAVRLLPGGRVVVADRGSSTIRIYGPNGEIEGQMGGSGEGPGEFTYITRVWFLPPDTLAAYDWRPFRLTKLLTSGELASTLRFQGEDGRPEIYVGTTSEGDHVLAWIQQEPRDASTVTPDVMKVGRFGADGRFETLLTTTVGMRRMGSPLPFSPHFLATMIGDSVYLTDGLDGTIDVVDAVSGEPVRTLRVEAEEQDPEEAWEALEAGLDAPGRLEQLREARDAPGTDSIPAFAEMLRDHEGRLWLKRYDPATDSHWRGRRRTGGEWVVVRPDGRTVARVTIPEGLRLMEVREGKVAGITRDALDVERVRVHELVRDGASP